VAARLSDHSPKLAEAFMSAAPGVTTTIGAANLEAWAQLGQRLGSGGWSNVGLATRFFATSADLFEVASIDQADRLVAAATRLAGPAPDLAASCVCDAPGALGRMAAVDRDAFVTLITTVSRHRWAEADRYLEIAPTLLDAVAPPARSALLEIAAAAVTAPAPAPAGGPGGFARFATAAAALAELGCTDQAEVVAEARAVAATDGAVALELIASSPTVAGRLEADAARRWRAQGREVLQGPGGRDRALAWFRLEAGQARDLLAELAGRVELAEVSGLLRLYAQALSGRPLIVQTSEVLVRKGIGWVSATRASSDGVSIFLPPTIDTFDDHEANFQAYKVHTTLQAARLDNGSFRFALGVDGTHLPATIHRRIPDDRRDTALLREVPLAGFLAAFDHRALAAWLLGLAEGTRIDAIVTGDYPGVAPALARLRACELTGRLDPATLPDRQAAAEHLVRAALGVRCRVPAGGSAELRTAVQRGRRLLDTVRRPGATIQDAAEVAAGLYDLIVDVPNLAPPGGKATPEGGRAGGGEVDFDVPDQPELLGDFRPELVQVMDALASTPPDTVTLDTDELVDLLADSLADSLDREAIEAVVENLAGEATARAQAAPDDLATVAAADTDGGGDDNADDETREVEAQAGEDGGEDDEQEGDGQDTQVRWFHYDEWDFRAQDYLPEHCRLGERDAQAGDPEAYAGVLAEHHRLVVDTRRRFEALRPEAFRRIHRLEDGSDIDLDEAIEFHADKRAGAGPLARFYTRRNKVVRDVAVGLLLDLSASTGEPAGVSERVIDVERAATVVMIEALEAIGDNYGIWGFSGQGRHQVELHTIKELEGRMDDTVRARVAAMEPVGATRMGPAIRHVTTRLEAFPAKVKILIMVSDGRPQDEDYGPERGDVEYALHDTRHALTEARRRRIEPFLITVDPAGHEYLGQMCDNLGYEVVSDVSALPRRLPRLYRYLTAD
jgi:hypothetical protein